jgi:hypothetical protein
LKTTISYAPFYLAVVDYNRLSAALHCVWRDSSGLSIKHCSDQQYCIKAHHLLRFTLPRKNTADFLLYLPRTSLSDGTTLLLNICAALHFIWWYKTTIEYLLRSLSSENTAGSLLRSTMISNSLLRPTIFCTRDQRLPTATDYLLHSAPLCPSRRLPTVCCYLFYLMVIHYSRLSSELPLSIVPYPALRDYSLLSAALFSIWHYYITPTIADSKMNDRETDNEVDNRQSNR